MQFEFYVLVTVFEQSFDIQQTRLDAAGGTTCGKAGDGYIIINGAEPHTNADGNATALAQNNDPLDVFCGAWLCNAHADAPANSCDNADNAYSTVVGKRLFPGNIFLNDICIKIYLARKTPIEI